MSAPGIGGGVTLGAVASGPGGGIVPGGIPGPVGGGASQLSPLINSSRAFLASSFCSVSILS